MHAALQGHNRLYRKHNISLEVLYLYHNIFSLSLYVTSSMTHPLPAGGVGSWSGGYAGLRISSHRPLRKVLEEGTQAFIFAVASLGLLASLMSKLYLFQSFFVSVMTVGGGGRDQTTGPLNQPFLHLLGVVFNIQISYYINW
jgi:hypothetical protein